MATSSFGHPIENREVVGGRSQIRFLTESAGSDEMRLRPWKTTTRMRRLRGGGGGGKWTVDSGQRAARRNGKGEWRNGRSRRDWDGIGSDADGGGEETEYSLAGGVGAGAGAIAPEAAADGCVAGVRLSGGDVDGGG